jgi:polyisoprenyl-phosphate glycosyltransferase
MNGNGKVSVTSDSTQPSGTPTRRKKVSVVIPVYYNEGSLPHLFEDLKGFENDLEKRELDLELIFVDDGSGDRSLSELHKIREERPETKVIKLSRNFGAVAASKTGFRFVTGDCFGILAADQQDPVAMYLEMVDAWLEGEKFVICVRHGRDDPVVTRFFAEIYYFAIRRLVAPDYPSGGFDLMLLDSTLLTYMVESGMNTHPNLYAYWLGIEPKTLTYHRQKREHGVSRWTFRKKLKLFVDTISGFSVVPLRLISGFGLLVAIMSFLYGLYIVINALMGRMEQPGFATLVVLITFFSGLILVMLGIIGEYLWRIFETAQKKPESVIDETFQG